jgi:serine/threonine protein kinase/tetratricopeptide (TPR) repeat protein
MATVYLAHDLKHDRDVALKVLHPELAATLGPERFQREIRTTARLQHPHILPVLDSGEAAGQLWYTMPFVEGESLRDGLRRERQLPVDQALQITHEVADALNYAHSQGVVHRDIKPENILLNRGHALVADFGVARALHVAGGEGLTETGISVGTPMYMSPEQSLADGALDGRSDLYSLGCVLYEMLVGEPPFTGPTSQVILAKRLSTPPPPIRAVRPAVPMEVERAVTRALAPVAADRFASIDQFSRALTVPEAAPAAPAGLRPTRRLLAVGAACVLALTALLIVLLRRGADPPDSPGTDSPTRIAVLPFENIGRSDDEYFADGMTDEVRGRLAVLPALTVIARASSSQYKQTTKAPAEIGRELGVQYLLTATVRWDKAECGNRVRVTPELIQASDASMRWRQPFEADITDVFAVQGQIAGEVAHALDVALGTREQRTLSQAPTRNLAAYDAFLKGNAAAAAHSQGFGNLQRALGYYEQAVALDSTFAQAWARLGTTRALLYSFFQYDDITAARDAAEQAVALAPELPDGYRARGDYYYYTRRDVVRATQAYDHALKLAPRDAELLTNSALAEQGLGRWESSLNRLARARDLDPRSVSTATQYAFNLNRMRRFREGLAAADRAIAQAPADLNLVLAKVLACLGMGDLEAARQAVREVPSTVQPTALAVWLANFSDLYWVLDDAQQRLLLRLPPSAFGDERAIWASVRAQVYHLRGDLVQARVYADSARLEFAHQVESAPDDPQRRALLAVALAYMGRKADAIKEGERATAMLPMSADAGLGSYVQHQLVRVYILTGEPEKALDRLEPLLRTPYDLSPGMLRVDPNFDPLRRNPRFQRLADRPTE